MCEVGRQQSVDRTVLDEQLAFGNRIAEHGALVEFCDGRLGQLVVGVGKHMECLDEQADADGGIEAEGFVTNDANLRHVLAEIVSHQRNGAVSSHENGDILRLCSFFEKHGHGIGQLL